MIETTFVKSGATRFYGQEGVVRIEALVTAVTGAISYVASEPISGAIEMPEWVIQGGALSLLGFALYRIFIVELPSHREELRVQREHFLEEARYDRAQHRDDIKVLAEHHSAAMRELAAAVRMLTNGNGNAR